MKGTRADVALFEQGHAKSRENARALIMAGIVFCDGVRIEKPGDSVKEGAVLTVKENPNPFVSRGGLKLKKALCVFPITPNDKVCVDLGASSGGFTDCMLKSGAKKVYAIDVGYGQLDWTLRNDDRVVVMERTNARFMETSWFSEGSLQFATLDLSFISVKLILSPLFPVLCVSGEVCVLVKPQFEAGRDKIGKNGVVRDENVHFDVLSETATFCEGLGFSIIGMDYSPIKGPKGNIEYLLALRKEEKVTPFPIEEFAKSIVTTSHTTAAFEHGE